MYIVCVLNSVLDIPIDRVAFTSMQDAADYAVACSEDESGYAVGVFAEDGSDCYAVAYDGELFRK